MSKKIIRKVYCDKCHKEFDATFYASINVTVDPDLKDKIMSGDIFLYECPFCHKKHYIPQPFLYNDMDRQYMIYQGAPAELLDCEKEFNKTNENMKKEFDLTIEGYKCLGVDSFSDLRSKIIMLDNGLDYRIGTLYELVTMGQVSYCLREEKIENFNVLGAHFDYDDDGKLCNRVDLEDKKDPENSKTIYDPFDKEKYEKIEKSFSKNLNEVYTFFFDANSARKFFFTPEDKIKEYKKTSVEMATIRLINGNHVMAFVPAFNKGKYKVGDIVIAMKDKNVFKGTITAFYPMSRYALPLDINDMPAIAWKSKDIGLTATRDSDEEVDNHELVDILGNKEDKTFDNKLANADVITILETNLNEGFNLDPDSLQVGDTLPIDSLEIKFSSTLIDGRKYINAYLTQENCKNYEGSKAIYNFETLVNVALNSPEKFAGVLINPGENEIIFNCPMLLKHRRNIIMCDSEKMKQILKELKPNEIDYITKLNYEIICSVYFKKQGPRKIAEEMGKDVDEIHKALDQGYMLLTHVIFDNYQFDFYK